MREASPSLRSASSRRIPHPIITGSLVSEGLLSRFQAGQQEEVASPCEERTMAHASLFPGGENVPPNTLAHNSYGPRSETQMTTMGSYGCGSTQANSLGLQSRDPIDINPYAHRADEIGPTHRIPGVGYLGNLLVPPGWKEGDEPIEPAQAQALYIKGRKEAQDALNKMTEEIGKLPKEEQERRSEERDEEWSRQFKKDDLILRERIKIYDDFRERRSLRNEQQKQASLESLRISQPYRLPPMQPPASTSFTQYPEPLAPLCRSSSGFEIQPMNQGT